MYPFHLNSYPYFVPTQDDVDRAVSEAVKTFGKKDIMVNNAAYTTSKQGVVGLTRQVACEYAKSGIRVNAVCPGGITTGMTQDLFKDSQFAQYITSMTPMREVGKPEDIVLNVYPYTFYGKFYYICDW